MALCQKQRRYDFYILHPWYLVRIIELSYLSKMFTLLEPTFSDKFIPDIYKPKISSFTIELVPKQKTTFVFFILMSCRFSLFVPQKFPQMWRTYKIALKFWVTLTILTTCKKKTMGNEALGAFQSTTYSCRSFYVVVCKETDASRTQRANCVIFVGVWDRTP